MNADPEAWATAVATDNNVTITLKPDGTECSVDSSDGNQGSVIWAPYVPTTVPQQIADAINAFDWDAAGIQVGLEATESGNTLTVRAKREGLDGNMIRLYTLATGATHLSPSDQQLSGGESDVTWHVSVDFDALGLTDLQRVWMTFAPSLANGAAYEDAEWEAAFSNWSVTDTSGARALKVAGPGSVRIEEDSPWVARTGFWEPAPAMNATDGFAFWSNGRAIRAASAGAALTIETHCDHVHDIYVGTRLDFNCGKVQAYLDGTPAPAALDCYTGGRQVRRLLFSNVPAGQHTVEIRLTGEKNDLSSGWYFYFDFLECAVPSALVPDAPETRTDIGVATDFDTDHTFKLSPQRLLWNIQRLGLVGEIDHYCGVFWIKQAAVKNRVIPSVTFTFSGTFEAGDGIYIRIGPEGTAEIGKSVFAQDTSDTIALHFAAYLNETAVGVWAEASGNTLTVHCRSANSLYLYDFAIRHDKTAGTISQSADDLKTGATEGDWMLDPAPETVMNRAARDWHADFFATLAAAGMGVTVALSQELVNPPDDPAGGAIWVQRFADNTPVRTATGYHNLHSSHCALNGTVQAYMARAYSQVAGLMASAGITPRLQFGEVLWWYQPNPLTGVGMAYYDADTTAAFGGTLATFSTPNDSPAVNGYADANFLRARLKSYVDGIRAAVLAAYPTAQFELLWPMDVNDPDIRQLNRYVNLPLEWATRSGSGFDTLMVEGFEYPGVAHDLDKARRCVAYPFTELSWPVDSCRYLAGAYYSSWPWQREYTSVQRTGVPMLKYWAYDHICLFGWPLPLRTSRNRAQLI